MANDGTPSHSPLKPGDRFGQYRIVRFLGRGGMGEVVEAEHVVLGRTYALKLIPPDLAARSGFLERFQREAKVMANLEHPHVVRVDEYGETDGRYWMRMERAEGVLFGGKRLVSLDRFARALGGRMEETLVARLLAQVLKGLAYAHGRGVVHRDLKPANILLEGDSPEAVQTKISDFGLVRVVGEEWVLSQAQQSVSLSLGVAGTIQETGRSGTSTQAFLGTYAYMAPEQKRGQPADTRSDLYAAGLLAFRLLTGQEELGLELPNQVDPSLHPGWDDWVRKAVRADPDGRFQSAEAMQEALDGVRGDLDQAGQEREIEEAPPEIIQAPAVLEEAPEPEEPVEPPMPPPSGPAKASPEEAPKGKPKAVWAGLALLVAALAVTGWLLVGQGTSEGTLRVESTPSGAEVLVDGVNQGVAPLHVDGLDAGLHQVVVRLAGYEEGRESIRVEGGEVRTLRLALEPLPFGTLRVESEPDGAQVLVDGMRRGATPLLLEKVAEGSRLVRVEQEGYEPVERRAEVKRLEETRLKVVLSPAVGGLRVTSDPSGARVSLAGRRKSTTPMEAGDLVPGRYKVRVTLDGFRDWERSVLVEAGKTTGVHAALSPLEAGLRVESEPPGARVTVDGRDRGTTPVQVKDLDAGVRRVSVSRDCFEAASKEVRLQAGESQTVRFALNPVCGTLGVETDPEDARIRILNIGPLFEQGMALEAGRYHVEVTSQGYETWKEWVDLEPGEEKRLTVRLEEERRGPPKRVTNSLGMEFVWIEPGSFMMGSPEDEAGRDDDEKQHLVTLTQGYYLMTTEVTQGQWRAVMGENPSYFKNCGDDCPVERVSWNDVQEFIRKLNAEEGTDKYRLPTEAEWEYACRAGTEKPFSFGECLSTDEANYDGNHPLSGCPKGEYRKTTVKVGSFSANAWGLHDMHGNVWEWCQDIYARDADSKYARENPIYAGSGRARVIRGGSWNDYAGGCRSAYRYRRDPEYRDGYLGFRLARTR